MANLLPTKHSNDPDLAKTNIEDKSRAQIIIKIILICLVILAGLYSSWVLLISFALLPSVLIRQIDKKEKSTLIFAVTGLNATGLLMALQHSYKTYGIFPDSGQLFADWFNWLAPFGMAWTAILIFMIFPVALKTIIGMVLQNKEKKLREQQKTLLKDWGRQITLESKKGNDKFIEKK